MEESEGSLPPWRRGNETLNLNPFLSLDSKPVHRNHTKKSSKFKPIHPSHSHSYSHSLQKNTSKVNHGIDPSLASSYSSSLPPVSTSSQLDPLYPVISPSYASSLASTYFHSSHSSFMNPLPTTSIPAPYPPALLPASTTATASYYTYPSQSSSSSSLSPPVSSFSAHYPSYLNHTNDSYSYYPPSYPSYSVPSAPPTSSIPTHPSYSTSYPIPSSHHVASTPNHLNASQSSSPSSSSSSSSTHPVLSPSLNTSSMSSTHSLPSALATPSASSPSFVLNTAAHSSTSSETSFTSEASLQTNAHTTKNNNNHDHGSSNKNNSNNIMLSLNGSQTNSNTLTSETLPPVNEKTTSLTTKVSESSSSSLAFTFLKEEVTDLNLQKNASLISSFSSSIQTTISSNSPSLPSTLKKKEETTSSSMIGTSSGQSSLTFIPPLETFVSTNSNLNQVPPFHQLDLNPKRCSECRLEFTQLETKETCSEAIQCAQCQRVFHQTCIPSFLKTTLEQTITSFVCGACRGTTCLFSSCSNPPTLSSLYCSSTCGRRHASERLNNWFPSLSDLRTTLSSRITHSDFLDIHYHHTLIQALNLLKNEFHQCDLELTKLYNYITSLTSSTTSSNSTSSSSATLFTCGYPFPSPQPPCDTIGCQRHRSWRRILKAQLELKRLMLIRKYKKHLHLLKQTEQRYQTRQLNLDQVLFHSTTLSS